MSVQQTDCFKGKLFIVRSVISEEEAQKLWRKKNIAIWRDSVMEKTECRRLDGGCGTSSRKRMKQRKILGVGLAKERGGNCNLKRGIVRMEKAKTRKR